MDNTKRALAYIRVSSVRQIDNESPETQRKMITQYAAANNIDIIDWFTDEAKSGKNADRKELQSLLAFALSYRKHKIDHVIVYKMNRASRDIDSYVLQIRAVLQSRGITIRSATEQFDDTSMGRFLEIFHVMVGQMDNETKRDTTKDNMRSLALQGYWQHPPIVGYENCTIQNDTGKPRPSLKPSSMAPKVKQVLERFAVGDITKAQLTRYAAEIGLRSRYGNKLSEDSINRMLKAPEYAGYVHDKFTDYELIEGKHPGLIAVSTYERNQSLIFAKNSRKGEVHLNKNAEYPLKGLLLCANCKKTMYASAPTTGNGGRSPRYHCARSECKGKTNSVTARVVHESYKSMLEKIKPTTGTLKLYKQVLIREASRDLDNLNRQISNARQNLDRISTLRSNTIQKYVEDTISLEEKNQLVDALEKEKLASTLELSEFEQAQSIREADIEYVINFMDNVGKQWEDSDIDIKQRFQSMLFPEGLVYDPNSGKFGTSQISALYRYVSIEKGAEAPSKSDLVAGAGLEPATLWL